MVKLGRDTMQVVEEQDIAAYPMMPIVGQSLFRQILRSADTWKQDLPKVIPVVLLTSMVFLFVGVIGGRVIKEMDEERNLRMEIQRRLFYITR